MKTILFGALLMLASLWSFCFFLHVLPGWDPWKPCPQAWWVFPAQATNVVAHLVIFIFGVACIDIGAKGGPPARKP